MPFNDVGICIDFTFKSWSKIKFRKKHFEPITLYTYVQLASVLMAVKKRPRTLLIKS